MLYKRMVFLFVVSLHVGPVQSMDQNDTFFNEKGLPIKEQIINDLTMQLSRLTATESSDDNCSINDDPLLGLMESSAAQVKSELDDNCSFVDYSSQSNFEKDKQSSSISADRKAMYKSTEYHQKASTGLQSPPGLNPDGLQAAMHGSSQSPVGERQLTRYNLRSSQSAAAGRGRGYDHSANKESDHLSTVSSAFDSSKKRGISGDSAQSKVQLKKARISENNQVLSKKIDQVLEEVNKNSSSQKKTKRGPGSILTTPQQNDLIKLLQNMQRNTSGSRQKASTKVLSGLKNSAAGNKKGSIVQENQIFKDIFESDAKAAQVACAAASILPQDEIRQFAFVDVDHVTHGEVNYKDGKPFLEKGLHSFERCVQQKLFDSSRPVFIGQDHKTMGLFVGDAQKTMRYKFDEEDALLAVRQANSITKSKGNSSFTISQIQDGTFIASYTVPGKPLIIPTVFPVLVVNGNFINKNDQIYIGKFVKFNADGKKIVGDSCEQPLFIPALSFKTMMQVGENFETGDENLMVSDITTSIEEYFFDLLNSLGMNKFPAKIYGMLDHRQK